MKNYLLLILICFSFPRGFYGAEEIDGFCYIDDESEESNVFYCKENQKGTTFVQRVDPLLSHEAQLGLEETGVRFITKEEFSWLVTPEELLKMMGEGPNGEMLACFERVYYRTNEFNRLRTNDATIQRVIKLARALQEAGVCDLPVKKQNFNSIGIENSQDVLHHFLCISNSESVFGRENIGQGGRGPWGIHPMHNQKAGTRAFVDGRTVTLRRNGVCYPSRAVVRDANGAEIKQNSAYHDEAVILDNAKCAMTLYREKGFTDWGRTNVWGSNRHCSANTRDRLEFFKHIGALGCCTQECRQRYTDL